MAARNGQTVDVGASTRIPPKAGDRTSVAGQAAAGQAVDAEEPLVGRYPIIAFSYDTDASRLVMLMRDPADGKTVSQIPTEAALKQYKEAQSTEKKEKRAAELEIIVGGTGGGTGGGAGSRGSGRSSSSSPFSSSSSASAPAGSGSGRFVPPSPATSAGGASPATASVAFSPVATTPISTAAASGAGRVNVVI